MVSIAAACVVLIFALVTVRACSADYQDPYKRFITVSGATWGPWSAYSSCQPSCPGGTKTRTRHCYEKGVQVQSSKCSNSVAVLFTRCTQYDCPTTSHGPCADKLSNCHSYGKTSCGSPYTPWAHENCKKYCGFCSETTVAPTVAHGTWSHWSSFTHCSVTCGTGTYYRTRTCNGGHSCVGSSRDVHHCYQLRCPVLVNGVWGGWSHWSACSASCDIGTITRTRACNHPAPANGGHTCPGASKESHECSNGPCPTWSHWFEGACSVTCGNGTQERLRHCSTGRDADCAGEAYQHVPCTTVKCV